MYRQNLLDYLCSSSPSCKALYPTKILKQYWKGGSFSYLSCPRPDFGFLLLLKGNIRFISENRVLSAEAGNLIFLPKNCYYEAIFDVGTENYLVCFDTSESFPDFSEPLKLFDEASFFCAERFRIINDENFSGTRTRLYIQGLFYLLLDAIATNPESEREAHYNIVCKAKGLLENDENISIADIAKKCAVSESGLRRIFRERIGISPGNYRMEIRLKRATYLLESTDMTVTEISEKLGFFDAAYFCKLFKKRYGKTPMEYSEGKKL